MGTLGLNAAAGRDWDVLVVGAGPAGSLAARELARRGRAVLLIDKSPFPRGKVCGCCLNGSALATLDAVGLGRLVADAGGVPLSGVRVASGRASARLTLPGGASLSRERFDAALADAAVAAGATFLPGTLATEATLVPGGRTIRLRAGAEKAAVRCRLLLVADGLAGQLRVEGAIARPEAVPDSRIGAGTVALHGPTFYEPGTIYLCCGPGGYVGLVRLEDGRLDLAAALVPAAVRSAGGVGPCAAALLAGSRWPAPAGIEALPWRGTPALTRTANCPAAERCFLLGDAAGYVEPFTGEGMAWALASAVALAPLADSAVEQWEPDLPARWSRRLRSLLGGRRRACRLVTLGLRRPWLLGAALRVLAVAPWLASAAVRAINRPVRLSVN